MCVYTVNVYCFNTILSGPLHVYCKGPESRRLSEAITTYSHTFVPSCGGTFLFLHVRTCYRPIRIVFIGMRCAYVNTFDLVGCLNIILFIRSM